MASLLASAVIAVSVNVINPAAPVHSAQWATMEQASLGQSITQWAVEAGRPAPQIDPAVANIQIGRLSVKATDYCGAVSRLVSAFSFGAARPQIAACNEGATIITASAN